MQLPAVICLACVVGVSGCVADLSHTGEPQPPESRLAVESQSICIRIMGPGWTGAVANTTATVTASRLNPGNRVLRTNAEWKALWNAAKRQTDTDPPIALPDGYVAIAVTVEGSIQTHTHVRRIAESAAAASIQTQTEARIFPVIDGTQTVFSDDGFVETLVVFLPNMAKKEIIFETLPILKWTPETNEKVMEAPPCPYRDTPSIRPISW
jgi:hypothetical protein